MEGAPKPPTKSREKSSRSFPNCESHVRDQLSTKVTEADNVPYSWAEAVDDPVEHPPVEDSEVTEEGDRCGLSAPNDMLEAPSRKVLS